jgi:hypothetical protein
MRTTSGTVIEVSPKLVAYHRPAWACRQAERPIHWWRIRPPKDLGGEDVRAIRRALLSTDLVNDPDWFRAVGGDAANAIGIAVKTLKINGLKNSATDAVMSAVLCCAIEGDPAAKMVMISALRRRSKIDPICYGLRLRWLHFRF